MRSKLQIYVSIGRIILGKKGKNLSQYEKHKTRLLGGSCLKSKNMEKVRDDSVTLNHELFDVYFEIFPVKEK
jgi:hypothetical protein